MKISLRRKKNANGKTSLFLEYYYGYIKDVKGKIKHHRKYEFLDIQIITDPKNAEERKENKQLEEIANNVLKSKQVEKLKTNFDLQPDIKSNVNFFDYFTQVVEEKGLEKNSSTNYNNVLKHLANYCNPDTTTFKQIDVKFLTGFKKYLNDVIIFEDKNLSDNTKYSYFSIVKSVVTHAYKNEVISKNPFLNIRGFPKLDAKKMFLTFEEVQKLKNTKCKKEVIKRAFLFSCFCGLRFSDVQALKWNQIEVENGKYRMVLKQIKTKENEYFGLNNQAVEFLGERGKPDDKIFKGLMYSSYFNPIIDHWVISAGIDKHITFHASRHTFGTLLLTNGVDIYTVSKLLGHKNVKTTEIYAKVINLKLVEAVNKLPELK
ncbi:MAG: tyrosine-type recombinase/integrase [Ignavibacteria bacterium]